MDSSCTRVTLLFLWGTFPTRRLYQVIYIRTTRVCTRAHRRTVCQRWDPVTRVLSDHCDGKLLLSPGHWSGHHLYKAYPWVTLGQQDSYRELGRFWLPSLATDTKSNSATWGSLQFHIQEVCQGLFRVSRVDRGCRGLVVPVAWRWRVSFWCMKVSTSWGRGGTPHLARSKLSTKARKSTIPKRGNCMYIPCLLQHPSQAAASPGKYNPSLKPPVSFTMLHLELIFEVGLETWSGVMPLYVAVSTLPPLSSSSFTTFTSYNGRLMIS